MGLTMGSVTPLGLLNDEALKVRSFIDDSFFGGRGLIGCHPNDNTAILWIKTQDLVDIINEHGNEVAAVKL